jgi:sortase A
MKGKTVKKVVAPKAHITFRHNFLPPLIGFFMALSVYGLLNAQWIAAQYEYHFVKPPIDKIVATYKPDPSATPELIIPAINIKAPIVFGVTSYDSDPVQKALQQGVLHYGQTANPGQNGNVVIVGHSSGAPWTPGDYKFVFTLLDKLKVEDKIIVDYSGTRYIYEVIATEIIQPTDLKILQQPTDKFDLTLVTCTPVGTSQNRLIVRAEQKSPKPQLAENISPENKTVVAPTSTKLPDSASSSLWGRIKQWF